ncbi:MAG: HlyC/CorC family transporter, partial [Chloroflexi bacterium]|nr:HlyC/CorC family transporter [Chloroflexota bacterium]
LIEPLSTLPVIGRYAEAVALGMVVIAITYLTLVFGELVPKRLALLNPERAATILGPPMRGLSMIAFPVVRVLSFSTDAVLALLGARNAEGPNVTEEEIKVLIAQAAQAGVVDPVEQDMVERTFRFGDLRAAALMTPRPELTTIDLSDPSEENRKKIAAEPHTFYPVHRTDPERVLGVLSLKSLWQAPSAEALNKRIEAALEEPLYIPESMPALRILDRFRQDRVKMGLVVDEFGALAGLITLTDVMEAIVGELPDAEDEVAVVTRADGSFLVDGLMVIDEFQDHFDIEELPNLKANFHTVGGFVMTMLDRLPQTGDIVRWDGWQAEIVDMDGNRIDKILLSAANESRNRGNDDA